MGRLTNKGCGLSLSRNLEKFLQVGFVDRQDPASWHVFVQFRKVFPYAIHVVCKAMLEADLAHAWKVIDLAIGRVS